MGERFDLLDEDGKPLGYTKDRKLVHREGVLVDQSAACTAPRMSALWSRASTCKCYPAHYTTATVLTAAALAGDWHRVAHVWLYVMDTKELLLQKRCSFKDSWPGKWDISSAGHSARLMSYEPDVDVGCSIMVATWHRF